jgi:hypothetical protein
MLDIVLLPSASISQIDAITVDMRFPARILGLAHRSSLSYLIA